MGLSTGCCRKNNGDDDLPLLERRGTPMWTFRCIRFLLCLCPLDVWVAFPILIFLGGCAVGMVIGLNDRSAKDTVLWIIFGVLAGVLLIFWLYWARRNPRVPQEEDVASFKISEGPGSWPKAPIAPVRGELVSKGGSWFKDQQGRRMLLRGINCAGGCKMPTIPSEAQQTHFKDDRFYDYKHVSFVGRPFPLEEADLHLGRLCAMGYNFLRFLITWEAVEHEGPGIYDEEYLAYLKAVIQKCVPYGISVFVDAHQDVWSRWTGGDGAPAWTLTKLGFDLEKLDESACAITQQNWDEEKEGPFPKMVWNSNNARLAAGTMWTLFFAGNDFAPQTMVDGEPVQEWLQNRFCAFLGKVAQVLKDEPNVVGFDLLNEPSNGFINVKDARDIGPNMFWVGWRVSPWDAMELGAGRTRTVDYFSSFMTIDGKRTLNPNGVCVWKDGPESCVWHQNGVWEMRNGEPKLLKPKYFHTNPKTGNAINLLDDYAIPFWRKAAKVIRAHIPDAIIFAEPILDMCDPSLNEQPELTVDEVGEGYVWARHNYDGITLMTKSFNRYLGVDPITQKPSVGMQAIELSYGKGIATFKDEASKMGPDGCPVLVGECGIPFDLHDKRRIHGKNIHDFNKCTHALNTTMRALEHALVSYTIWTYEPDNTNLHGDGWNGEDLSLFSKDQVLEDEEDNLFAGGRSLLAAIRAYPCRVAGDVTSYAFHPYHKERTFTLKFHPDHTLPTKETEIFLPKFQYPRGVDVSIRRGDGTYTVNWERQTLTFCHSDTSGPCKIVVKKKLMETKKMRRRGQHQGASSERSTANESSEPEESTRLVAENV